jgi:hypothetical protein
MYTQPLGGREGGWEGGVGKRWFLSVITARSIAFAALYRGGGGGGGCTLDA